MLTNAGLIATNNFKITGPPLECVTCTGSGLVGDTRALSIGGGIRVINRRCKPCGGSGEIFPLAPLTPKADEVGEVPAWMLG